MKRRDALLLTLLALLAFGVAVQAARVADRHQVGGAWRAELGRHKRTEVEPRMRARLEGLADRLVFTYYVSARSAMPSAMKRVEGDVVDLLEAFRDVAPDRVRVHIVDPETDPEQQGYASNRRITPFRVRDVTHDAWSERLVWSTLTMSYGAGAEAVVNGLTPERLGRLQVTLLEHLDRMATPEPARIALAAPGGFEELASALAGFGRVERVDLDAGAALPGDLDVLLWMAPRNAPAERLRDLEEALANGVSVVLAGSLIRLDPDAIGTAADGQPTVRAEPSGLALEPLLAHFGLRPEPTFVLDARSEILLRDEVQHPAPFLVRCIGPNQNFVTWQGQPNGHLSFHAPTPLELEPEVLAELGYEARVHATTSDDTWIQAPPFDGPRSFAELAVDRGQPVSKLPLMVSLEPGDPWHGRLVVLGATTPFEDGNLSREGVAHRLLLRTILDELTTPERLVAAAVAGADRPPPAPELGAAARLAWRLVVIALVPLVLAALAFARGLFGARSAGRPVARPLVLRALGAVVLALVVVRLTAWPDLRADATAEGLNSLAEPTRAIAARAGEAGPTTVRLYLSPTDRLPPILREPAGRLDSTLADFRRAGADLEIERPRVEDLDGAARAELEAAGVRPIRVTTRDEEVTTVRTIYSAVVLERDGRREVLAFEDAAAFEYLEFRLAFALWRLETGRHPKVAFAADAERLSAADDYERFQKKGLFAPKGNDAYSLARALLMRLDFDVVNVTPRQFAQTRATEIPADADLVVWMQPRRSISGMMEELVPYLHGGGRALVAAQHFRILSRQYRGRRFQMSYWPEPQNPDLDQVYLPECGVDLVREVLFDEHTFELMVDTELLGRGNAREYERQLSAREFQVRASASNFADHPIMNSLGDQAFPYPAYVDLDTERLAELGLRATPLMTTSERSWSYAWTGGFLEEGAEGAEEHVDGPPGDPGEPNYRGRLPLAVLVEGTFPRPAKALTATRGDDPGAYDPERLEGYPPAAPGRLLLIGCSRAFRDDRLHHGEFRADHLLVNAVADMALEPELASIATRHRARRGFGLLQPEAKLRWRSWVIGAPPVALLLLGLVVFSARRRGPAPRGTEPGGAE